MPERYDLYDIDRTALGRTHLRGTPPPAGTYHVVVAVWTIDDTGRLFLTKRDAAKQTYPMTWENTCGCVQAGETSMEAVRRELFEETGIAADASELTFLASETEEHAFIDTYLLFRNVPIEKVRLQAGETCDCRWVTAVELDEMIEEGLVAEPVVRRLLPLRKAINRALADRDAPLLR